MIEKLKKTIKDGDFYPTVPKNSELMKKINEIIRHVNLHEDSIKDILEILQPDMAKKTPSSPVDEFAEQRKWIGKLCKFRDDETDKPKIGVLKDIDVFVGDNDAFYITFLNAADNNTYFECEPVKPDDDIIYKGE